MTCTSICVVCSPRVVQNDMTLFSLWYHNFTPTVLKLYILFYFSVFVLESIYKKDKLALMCRAGSKLCKPDHKKFLDIIVLNFCWRAINWFATLWRTLKFWRYWIKISYDSLIFRYTFWYFIVIFDELCLIINYVTFQ